jgi:hypothetical protein
LPGIVFKSTSSELFIVPGTEKRGHMAGRVLADFVCAFMEVPVMLNMFC